MILPEIWHIRLFFSGFVLCYWLEDSLICGPGASYAYVYAVGNQAPKPKLETQQAIHKIGLRNPDIENNLFTVCCGKPGSL